ARAAGRVQLAAGGAVQAGVADDRGVLRGKRRISGRAHHDAATGHALAHAVVRLAGELDLHTAGVPRAQALTRRALQLQHDGALVHAVVAVPARDGAGQARADRAVGVRDRVAEMPALAQL